MNMALRIVQGLLAFAFIAAGAMKLFAYEKYKAMSEKQNGPSGLTRGLISVIGIAELAGAIGIVLPLAAGVSPWLSACGALQGAVTLFPSLPRLFGPCQQRSTNLDDIPRPNAPIPPLTLASNLLRTGCEVAIL